MNDKKIALVTGANKGIGLETVRQLAHQSITVLLGARDRGKGEAAAKEFSQTGLDVRPLEIDVDRSDSIRSAVAKVAAHRVTHAVVQIFARVSLREYRRIGRACRKPACGRLFKQKNYFTHGAMALL